MSKNKQRLERLRESSDCDASLTLSEGEREKTLVGSFPD